MTLPTITRNIHTQTCTILFYFIFFLFRFLCALPPVLRPDWAKRYSEIIKKGGVFVTLMYPIDNHEGGPPYAVSEQV